MARPAPKPVDVERELEEHAEAVRALGRDAGTLERTASRIAECLRSGGTVYLCGNGGSAADAQHVAAEFTGRFSRERAPLPAEALTANTSAITAIGNDYGFDEVFARQVKARVKKGDVLAGISTSGESENVLRAVSAARELGAFTVGFTGGRASRLAGACELCLQVRSENTARIQEAHILAWHVVCGMVEESLRAGGA